jgi:hypothetical protein
MILAKAAIDIVVGYANDLVIEKNGNFGNTVKSIKQYII